MGAELHIDKAMLQKVLTGPQGPAMRLIKQAQRATLAQAKSNAPVDTGALRNAHRDGPIVVTSSGIKTEIIASQKYAEGVHEGTKPHVIRPKNKKFLSWMGPGGRIFARSVNHPGSKPRPWLLQATRSAAGGLGFEVTGGK